MGVPSVVRVEDIMTPRSLFKTAPREDVAQAARIARDAEYNAVPLTEPHGRILSFWARERARVLRVSAPFRTEHNTPIEVILPRLVRHAVQFVHYRQEVVGLVDLSDLNKPLARIAFLHPMLQSEQAILIAARARDLSDDDVAALLSAHVVTSAKGKRRRARRENLDAPLLEFVSFGDVLKVGSGLGIVNISLPDIDRLCGVRNRLAHGSTRLVQHADDGDELLWSLRRCSRLGETTGSGSEASVADGGCNTAVSGGGVESRAISDVTRR